MAEGYPQEQRDAVYQVIAERRDVRQGFRPDPVPADVLSRVLAAAHQAPSVGFSPPWAESAASLPDARARAFDQLKIESITDTPVNIVVSCDRTRGGRHTLGRHTPPRPA